MPEAHDDNEYRGAFYRAVIGLQSTQDQQNAYYVPIYSDPAMRDQDVVAGLRDGIEFSGTSSVQFLSGLRGSGKTAELLRLTDELGNQGYEVVFADVEDYFNTELPLDRNRFLVALAAAFASSVSGAAQESVWRRLMKFFTRIRLEPALSLSPVELALSLRDDDSMAARVREVIESSRRAFREELHEYFADAARSLPSRQGVVMIVDSIDHFRGRSARFREVRESVEIVFSELAEDLTLPDIHVIYTLPAYVAPPPFGILRDVLNIKVAEKDGTPCEPGLAALTSIMTKRAPDGDVSRLFGKHLDETLALSGGLVRDLFRLTSELILATKRADELPATPQSLGVAVRNVQNNVERGLSNNQVRLLLDVQRTHELLPRVDEWPDATDLMAYGRVLKYPNGSRAWFGVHPLLRDILAADTPGHSVL